MDGSSRHDSPGRQRLVVKLAADPYVHRFSLPMDNVQWMQARQALLAILGNRATRTALTYVDEEGDAVRVTCESEFDDAVLQLQAAGQRVLRLRALPAATPAFLPDSPLPPAPHRASHTPTQSGAGAAKPVPGPVTGPPVHPRRAPRDVPHREAQRRSQRPPSTSGEDDEWVLVRAQWEQ